MPPIPDKSAFALAQVAFEINTPACANVKKKPAGGWPDAVSAAVCRVYKDCAAPSVYPFMVGGVATNSGYGYSLLLAVKDAMTAWNRVACTASLQQAVDTTERAREAAPLIDNSANATAPMNMAIAQLEMMETALRDAGSVIAAFEALPDGGVMPTGCLQSDVLINTDELAGKLFVHYLSVLNDKFEAGDFTEADVQDAHGWYVEIGKCKLAFTDHELAIIANVKAQIEAAQSQAIDSEPSVTAAAMLAEWRNM